jgi:hypothetical protein
MSTRIRTRRRPRPRATALVSRLVSLLGCTLTVQAAPVAAQERDSVPPSRVPFPAAPPWSEVGGGKHLSPTRARVTPPPVRHRAIHPPRVESPVVRLFPRAQEVLERRRAREASMRRHPAGKGGAQRLSEPEARDAVGRNASKRESALGGTPVAPLPDAHIVAIPGGAARDRADGCAGSERVRVGDTLWDIGRALIHSKDDAAIAAYVQRLHQLNRDVIGDDPDLILPGQRLQLPDCER